MPPLIGDLLRSWYTAEALPSCQPLADGRPVGLVLDTLNRIRSVRQRATQLAGVIGRWQIDLLQLVVGLREAVSEHLVTPDLAVDTGVLAFCARVAVAILGVN